MDILTAVLVAAALAFILWFLLLRNRPEGKFTRDRIGDAVKRLNDNMEKYKVMTADLLAQTPDEDVLEAVLSNLWAKMKYDMSDAQAVMSAQNRSRQYMFSIYAVTGGVKQSGFAKFKASEDAVWLPMAVAALETIDAKDSAALLREAIAAADAEPYNLPYLECFENEQGRELMLVYIREHARDFVDA